MQNLIESAAKKAGVSSEVLDLIGRDFICHIADDLPSLLLPSIMSTLKSEYLKNGLEWMRENLQFLQNYLIVLRQMYGPTGSEEFRKPDFSLVLP
jgi:hypothetical protein